MLYPYNAEGMLALAKNGDDQHAFRFHLCNNTSLVDVFRSKLFVPNWGRALQYVFEPAEAFRRVCVRWQAGSTGHTIYVAKLTYHMCLNCKEIVQSLYAGVHIMHLHY